MILYHGSNIAIEEIDLEKSRPCKDFGRGFYLSEDEEQAKQMANFKALTLGGDPIVTKFHFDWNAIELSNLNIQIFKDYSEEWADFVFSNREKDIPTKFDFVYGPIANDKIGLQIRKLKDGSIDKVEFLNRLKYMKGITFQYFFGTKRAIEYLQKI